MSLSFAQAEAALLACARSKITALVVGSPGLGKSALVRTVAGKLNMPCHELIGSNCDSVDIAGLPYIVDGQLQRSMLRQIKACVDQPGVLFLDELTSIPASVQAPLMRLLLESVAGDTKLHPDSWIVAAANKPEECPGGVELSAATMNRVIKFDDFQPTIDELRAFFDRAAPEGTRTFEEFVDFAATLAVNVDLLDMSPPKAAIDSGAPFGSPRAWERGLRAYAEYCEAANVGFNVGKDDDAIGYAILSGAVGEAKAIAFLAIRKMRKHLPSLDEIAADPAKARVPEKPDQQLAAIGLLARLASQDIWASWIYAERLLPEIGASIARVLMNRKDKSPGSKHATAGRTASVKLLAKTRRAMNI